MLTGWIIAAAASEGLPVQSTSIPGVAQRTGATTYYIEIFPRPWRELGGKRPVMALSPGIGDVDVVVASELLEAARTVAAGFVTPDRTLAIASTHRSHAIAEKMAMGDGRLDVAKLAGEVTKNAREAILFDMEAAARSAGAMINAVMLGAIAASGRLPMPVEAFAAAIRADGKAVEANLRGFAAGLAAARERCARARLAARRQNPRRARRKPRRPRNAGGRFPRRRRHRHRRAAPARRLAGRGLRPALPRAPGSRSHLPHAATSACCARPRAISRCACPMRTSSASPKRRSRRRVSPGSSRR